MRAFTLNKKSTSHGLTRSHRPYDIKWTSAFYEAITHESMETVVWLQIRFLEHQIYYWIWLKSKVGSSSLLGLMKPYSSKTIFPSFFDNLVQFWFCHNIMTALSFSYAQCKSSKIIDQHINNQKQPFFIILQFQWKSPCIGFLLLSK